MLAWMVRRTAILPARGVLLVSTDLHGSWDDFAALRGHFLRACACDWKPVGLSTEVLGSGCPPSQHPLRAARHGGDAGT